MAEENYQIIKLLNEHGHEFMERLVNFVQADAAEAAKNNSLEKLVKKHFG